MSFSMRTVSFFKYARPVPYEGIGVLNDAETIDLIRRANLDAFWSKEPTTISHNLYNFNRVLHISRELGLDKPPVPMLGLWPIEDKFGMGGAIVLLKHYLDPRVTETTEQYNTVQKMKSAFVNLYHASVENQGSAIVGGVHYTVYLIRMQGLIMIIKI
jgi:hypothetical protein